jgi:uncharacterized protein (TIGR02453 family)
MNEILEFLKELDANNNRAWFDSNRSRYEKTKKDFLDFTASLIEEIRKFDTELPVLQPKDCMFRIFRDVRFSNDKRPFKSNYGSYMARGGRKSGFAGYYFHIEPGEYFLSGGVYMPSPENLAALRQEIYYHTDEYIRIIENKEFKQSFDQHYFDPLKTAPKGFPKEWEHIDLIKNRSFGFGSKITEQELLADDLLENSIRSFKMLVPLNHFYNRAIEEKGND